MISESSYVNAENVYVSRLWTKVDKTLKRLNHRVKGLEKYVAEEQKINGNNTDAVRHRKGEGREYWH